MHSVGFSRGRAKAHGSLEVWWDCGPSSGWAVRLNQPTKDDRYVHTFEICQVLKLLKGKGLYSCCKDNDAVSLDSWLWANREKNLDNLHLGFYWLKNIWLLFVLLFLNTYKFSMLRAYNWGQEFFYVALVFF